MDFFKFVVILVVTAVTRTTTLTIEVTSDVVTVREGEQLKLSCSITFNDQGLTDVRWYRGTNQTLYGSIDITKCGVLSVCSEVNTTDNRGVVKFTRGVSNDGTWTLEIDHSLPRDNTSFSCGVITTSNTSPKPQNIYVIVQQLQDQTYPMCSLITSNSSTLTDILFLSCWAEITQPVVSLEWTVEGISTDQISLSNKTEIDEYQVENNLLLNESGVPSGSLVFTCHMTSWAFPHTRRNCSIGPILIPIDQTTEGTLPDAITTPFAQDGTSTTPFADNILPQNDHPLNTVVIAAIASACLVVIIIHLSIIACLVSSRRKRSRAAQKDPNDLSIHLSLAITSPGSNTNLVHESHVYSNQTNPATSSNNRPGRFELPPWDTTASPPSPLYAAVSSGKNVSHVHVGDGCSYAVVPKRDKRRDSTPYYEEDQPDMGHESQDPPEYHTLEPRAQGQVPMSTEGHVVYDVPGQRVRSRGSSQLDEDEGRLVDNILYTSPGNEYM